MTDRFDEAKRALESVPAPDRWAEAERRAHSGTVEPLTTVAAGGRPHRGRWLASAAAAAVLVAGTVAVLADDGDEPLTTEPSTTTRPPDEVTTYQADGACGFGIAGDPLPEPAAVSSVPAFQGALGTLAEGSLNGSQTYAVQSPGQVVTDLIGERVEDVQLRRGTATLWFQPDAVQVRWFGALPASANPGERPRYPDAEPCETFTVTVGGGTEDENRHAAVDLAERVRLAPSPS